MKFQLLSCAAVFAVLSLGIVSFAFTGSLAKAYAQPISVVPPQVGQVSGIYTNEDLGLTITLPDGWSGFSTSYGKDTSVLVTPGGLNGATQTPGVMMTLNIITKNSTSEKTLPDNVKQPPNTGTGQRAQCDNPTANQVTVNSMSGTLTTIDCSFQGKTWKLKDYFFQTNEKFISVGLIATSDANFSQNVGTFDSSANTLKISNTIEAPTFSSSTSNGNGLALGHLIQHKERLHFANNKDEDLSFDTSSNITNFNFDEGSRKIMFKVSGTDGTEGTTVLYIGSFLKGPYTVTFDGKEMTNFETATDNSTGQTTLTLHYHHSTHDVSVSGTEVVPEFPISALGGIAAIIGVVAILGRYKLINRE